ncbi:MAG: Cys-Gln thioester bond-forming surface protein, partial [Actinomycetia bacterium]|nr:Cys-Gln thioester bond-forming surface protein [Actinomycetes bacterium]
MKKWVYRVVSLAVTVTLVVLLVSVIAFKSSPAYAADTSYSATLRYYDNVQITYSLNYPSSGLWTGSADIPVGGMGNLGQIYCIDPFVAFHSKADRSYWDTAAKATVDIKGGYSVAAPWVVSPTLQQNYDAVRWLVVNGYRGDYLSSSDATSSASVARLQALYPSIPNIDKTVALMATKIAIWKTLVGDDLTIVRTSIDSAKNSDGSAKRTTLDRLVAAMVADAASGRATGVEQTSFTIDIQKNSGYGLAFTDDTDGYDYYGPITVSASLEHSSSSLALDKVFLSVSGVSADAVALVDANRQLLPNDQAMYGTNSQTQYLDGSAAAQLFSTSGSKLVSGDLYLRVPQNRTPANADELSIKARAEAKNVTLAVGTPVSFVGADSSGNQDWDAVQAFIGAASDGMSISLFAEANLSSGDTPIGKIYASKTITNGTPLDQDQQFTLRLLHATSAGGSPTVVNLSTEGVSVQGAAAVGTTSFTLKNGGQAVLSGLPAGADDWYWLEEVNSPSGYLSPRYSVPQATAATEVESLTSGSRTSAFQIDPATETAAAVFANTKEAERAHLFVGKISVTAAADGSPIDATVGGDPFTFQLESSADQGNTWQPVQLSASMFKSDGGQISNADQGLFTLRSYDQAYFELAPGLSYRVCEISPDPKYRAMYAYYLDKSDGSGSWTTTTSSSEGNAAWSDGSGNYRTEAVSLGSNDYCSMAFSNLDIKLVDLTISKTVTNKSADFNADSLFSFQVYFEDQNGLLLAGQPIPLSYDSPSDSIIVSGLPQGRISQDANGHSVLQLKDGESAKLTGLPAGSYRVVETPDSQYTTSYARQTADAGSGAGAGTGSDAGSGGAGAGSDAGAGGAGTGTGGAGTGTGGAGAGSDAGA